MSLKQPEIPAPAGSIMSIVAKAWSRSEVPVFPVRPSVRIGSATLIPVAIDNGNDALKGAVLSPDLGEGGSKLTTIRLPTAFAIAQEIQGRPEVTYSCDGITFWVGDTALRYRGGALRIGPTRQRLEDERQRWFIGAGIVELLRTAGYPPGEYQIALTLAVPNSEIVIERQGDKEQPTVDPATREMLTRYLKGKTWAITRVDDTGSEAWVVKVGTVLPIAQTGGTMIAAVRSPTGKLVSEMSGLRIVDIGGGDLHVAEVTFNPSRMINRRPSDGTIQIARVLRQNPKLASVIRNDVEAQQALISRKVMRSSRMVSIEDEVRLAVASGGQSMIADVLSELRDSVQFVIITGGGVLLLNGLLEDVLRHELKVAGQDYLLVDGPLATYCNTIGALFGLIFRAANKA